MGFIPEHLMPLSLLPLRVAGALSGVVYVPSLDASVQDLRDEVARLLGARSCHNSLGCLPFGPCSSPGPHPPSSRCPGLQLCEADLMWPEPTGVWLVGLPPCLPRLH